MWFGPSSSQFFLDNGEEGEAEDRDDQKRQNKTGKGEAWSEQAAENFIGCVERGAHPSEDDDVQQSGRGGR